MGSGIDILPFRYADVGRLGRTVARQLRKPTYNFQAARQALEPRFELDNMEAHTARNFATHRRGMHAP